MYGREPQIAIDKLHHDIARMWCMNEILERRRNNASISQVLDAQRDSKDRRSWLLGFFMYVSAVGGKTTPVPTGSPFTLHFFHFFIFYMYY